MTSRPPTKYASLFRLTIYLKKHIVQQKLFVFTYNISSSENILRNSIHFQIHISLVLARLTSLTADLRDPLFFSISSCH